MGLCLCTGEEEHVLGVSCAIRWPVILELIHWRSPSLGRPGNIPFQDTKPQTDHRNNVLFLELLVSLRIAFAPAFNTAKRIAGSWPALAEAKVPKELRSSQDKVQLIGDILPSHSPIPLQKEDGCFTTACDTLDSTPRWLCCSSSTLGVVRPSTELITLPITILR